MSACVGCEVSKELLPCPFCSSAPLWVPGERHVMCKRCLASAPPTWWNRRPDSPEVAQLRADWRFYHKAFIQLADALDGVSTDDTGRIGEVKPVDELVATIKQLQRNSADEGRADYFASLLTRLLATRQGRTVGYEPPEVQALWRKVEKALEGKEGEK